MRVVNDRGRGCAIRAGDDCLAEIAGAFRGGRDGPQPLRSVFVSHQLIAGKEEELVLEDRAADGAAEIVHPGSGRAQCCWRCC